MALPRKLKNQNVYQDGINWMGEIPSVSLPKLTRKMDDYRGGGMTGPVKIDYGQEGMELGFTAGGYLKSALIRYGASRPDGVLLRFAGAYQGGAGGDVLAVEVIVRGRYSEIDRGDSKPGDDSEQKFTMPLSFYAEYANGEEIFYFDFLAGIERVNGVDLNAGVMDAIGL